MTELWQLYDESGRPKRGKGATKRDVFGKGLRHGAVHVWIWRKRGGYVEVLLQQRGKSKPTWPGLLDVSAAGHIDLGEEPLQTAARETKEELGISINQEDLKFVEIVRQDLVAPNGSIENEYGWIYTMEMLVGVSINMAEDGELENVLWKPLTEFRKESLADSSGKIYVPHGRAYYKLVAKAINASSGSS